MPLSPGTRLGAFEVVAAIGAGGMGEVYRARDTKLQRDVALKILPDSLADDADRLARFEREATTLASLNHPNIAHVYGIEDSGATRALVMELVDGEDLAQRVARRALRLEDALPIARQIAEALAAAHQAGIVHRDLKPANIRIRPDGDVKVLDFGLARPATVAGRDGIDSSVEATITSPAMTQAGVILGTAAYMAPEQAKGRAVDRRTDIWAFGCVVFEMLAGQRAFSGDSVTDVLASVLTREPDWKALPTDLPDSLRRLLRRCLQKDPRQRLHDLADARLEIDDAIAAPPPAPQLREGRRRWVLGVGAVLLTALGAWLVTLTRLPEAVSETTRPLVRPQRLTDMVGLEETPALSPDGRSVAFTGAVNGKRQLFVRLVDGGGELLRITREDVDHQFPRWTPSSSSVVYFSPATTGERQGTLWELPALGGSPRRIATSLGAGDVRASDSRLAYFRLAENGIELVTAPLDGSSSIVAARFPFGSSYAHPRWSPDGKWIAYQQGGATVWDLFMVPAEGGDPQRLTNQGVYINGYAWLPDGTGLLYSSTRGESMLYLATSRLWQVSVTDGETRQVTSGEASYMHPDIASNGAVVVGRLHQSSDIWSFPTGNPPPLNTQKAVRITHQSGHVLTPTPSPDNREVAFLSDRSGHANLWVIDVESGAVRQITHERNPDVVVGIPVWSPTGRAIAFVSSREASNDDLGTWLVNPDGSHLRRLVSPGVAPVRSADGTSLYFTLPVTSSNPAGAGLYRMVEGGSPIRVRTDVRNTIGSDGKTWYFSGVQLVDGLPHLEITAAEQEDGPRRLLARVASSRIPFWQLFIPTLSPDGKWIAQPLTDGFTTNIFALSTSTGEWRQITDFGDRSTFIARSVSWSSDGRSVFAAVAEGDSDIVLLDGLLTAGRN